MKQRGIDELALRPPVKVLVHQEAGNYDNA